MRCALLAFAVGVAAVQSLAMLPPPVSCGWLAAIAASGLIARAFTFDAVSGIASFPRICKRLRFCLLLICAAALGFAYAALRAHDRLSDRLQAAWEGRDIALIGTVEEVTSVSAHGIRFLFAVERALPRDGAIPHLPARLSLAWYAGRDGDALPDIAPGARWQFTVRLMRPHGNANPYGFDYELRLLERGIGATGYVRGSLNSLAKPARLLRPFIFSPSHVLQRVRRYLRRKILAALPDASHAGVIVALAIGEQRSIEKTDWNIFRRTGVSHLVAIIGL